MKNLIIPFILLLTIIFSQKAISQESVNEELMKARNLVMQGQKEEASTILIKIMESQPDNKQAVQFWLMANMKRSPTGELDAVKQLDSLGAIYPKNTGIIFFKNFIYAEYGKNEEALKGFDHLIQLQPDSAINWIAKGQILLAMQSYVDAIPVLDKALSLDQKRFDVWGMKAAALAKIKNYDEAITTINKGIEIAPEVITNIYNRACIYCLKGDHENALKDLKIAIEKMPRYKQYARSDEDFKSLWENENFKKLTE